MHSRHTMRALAPVVLAALVTGCAGAAPAQPPATDSAAAASPACTLKTTFDYIVRDDNPGASVMAQEIGNADLATCTGSLSGFAAAAGQAPGECTTIAKASDNPGYDVSKVPAAPLKHVIESAGPGC